VEIGNLLAAVSRSENSRESPAGTVLKIWKLLNGLVEREGLVSLVPRP
jgi:hypothetical protein